jgi:hypothetical protein
MIHYSCAHLWPLGSLRLCVAGDNQRTFYLFSWCSKTIELERVTCRTQGFPGMGDKLVNQTLGWSVLTCWQVACDNDLAAGIDCRFLQDWLYNYCNYNCMNITRSGQISLPHAALTFHECQKFQRVPPPSLGHCAAKRLYPSASPRFPCRPPVLPPGCFAWGPQTPELTPFNTYLNWSTFALPNLTSDDSMCGNRSLILHIGSQVSKKSPLRRCQRHRWTPKPTVSTKRAALIMTGTHAKSPLLNFEETLKRGTRYITSIEIWKSHTHWMCWIWQKLYDKIPDWTSWNCTNCYRRGKLFKMATTSTVAPSLHPADVYRGQ